jgi:hypothetical protein
MRCEEVRQEFTGYVIGQAEEQMCSLIEQHLAVCADCGAEAAELKTLWTAMGSVSVPEPSPELRSRFQIMLTAYKHGIEQNKRRKWWNRVNAWLSGWWPRQPALQLGFSLGLLLLGMLVGRQFQSVRQNPAGNASADVAQLRDELGQMRQMVALSLMQQQSASDRLKGVNWSYELQQPGREVLTALLDTLMRDRNINVRLATVEALRQFGDQTVVRRGVVEAIRQEESPMVQVALIDLAVDLQEKESIETLRQLSADEDVNGAVRERALRGIEELE